MNHIHFLILRVLSTTLNSLAHTENMLSLTSVVSDSERPYGTVAFQAPLSMGFSRREYWSGLLCPPPEGLPDPGIEPVSVTSPASVCYISCKCLLHLLHCRWTLYCRVTGEPCLHIMLPLIIMSYM